MTTYREELRAYLKRHPCGRPDLRRIYSTPHGRMSTEREDDFYGGTLDYDRNESNVPAPPEPTSCQYMERNEFTMQERLVAREASALVGEYRDAMDGVGREGYGADTLLGRVDSHERFYPGFVDRQLPDTPCWRRTLVAVAAMKIAKEAGTCLTRGRYDCEASDDAVA